MSDTLYDLILTRPIARSKEFAAALSPRLLARIRLHYAPLLEIVPLLPAPDLSLYRGVIFSSAAGAACVKSSKALPAFCVGERTGREALDSGFEAQVSGSNADELVETIIRQRPDAPLVHLHGQHTRGDIAKRVSSAGIETVSLAVYKQNAMTFSTETLRLLAGSTPKIVPLFSPRTAQLFIEQVEQPPTNLQIVALSAAVADLIPSKWDARLHVADAPNAAAVDAVLMRIMLG